MKYTITNTATGQVTKAKTYRNAQKAVARMIASDVEGQIVYITEDGSDEITMCQNQGFTIAYVTKTIQFNVKVDA